MTIALGLSFAISTATGVLLLWLVWPRATTWHWPLALGLGAGLGAGLSAVLLFFWMLAFGPTRGFPLAEAALLLLAGAAAARGGRLVTFESPVGRNGRRGSRQYLLLGTAFLVTLGAAVAAFLSILRQHPHGEWDAWMNWDLRARMFYRGGDGWLNAFSAAIPWSHPDYPVLLPSLVARTWLYTGTETLLGPALVAGTFTFATVALLASAVGALRTPTQGLLAGLVLLSIPFFLVHGTSLYADVPVAFFFLATFVCLALDDRYGGARNRFAILAGVAAGFGMWTKNEGLLFMLAAAAGLLLVAVGGGWRASRGRLLAFATGLLPMLLLTAGFKIAFAPPNDLLSTLGLERTVARLTDWHRYYLVLRAYASHILWFGNNGFGSVTWVLAAYVLGLGLSPAESRRSWVRAATATLLLLLAGHFVVFVSMADELARLLRSSLDRLLLQLWPSALFLFFMAVRAQEETEAARLPLERAGEPGSRVAA
ncbi:MAG TPA: glycosyltransferase family 39 protein [Gemmatimonadales bacterium]|nr:glycosyltransferase family 39 protein [Gemmatimonadales bacterium]